MNSPASVAVPSSPTLTFSSGPLLPGAPMLSWGAGRPTDPQATPRSSVAIAIAAGALTGLMCRDAFIPSPLSEGSLEPRREPATRPRMVACPGGATRYRVVTDGGGDAGTN